MAAAYRPFDRVHAPLVSPLEDLNPATAHLKPEWATSFQRLQECFLTSLFEQGRDYSANMPTLNNENRYHRDDLLVFNVYKTLQLSTAYGLGPNPCAPFYIFYSGRHPADDAIQREVVEAPAVGTRKIGSFSKKMWKNIKGLGGSSSSSKSTAWTSDGMSYENKNATVRPNMAQFFLDRKDFSTGQSSTVVCVRVYTDYIDWRLVPPDPGRSAIATIFTNAAGSSSKAKGAEKPKSVHLSPNAFPALLRSVTRGEREPPKEHPVKNSFKKTVSMGNLKHKARLGANSAPAVPDIPLTIEPVTPTKNDPLKELAPTNAMYDIPAARIYLNPSPFLVTPESDPTAFVNEYTSGEMNDSNKEPIYNTFEDLGTAESQTITVCFSNDGLDTSTYWWVSDDSSWRIVYDKTQDVNVSSKRRVVPMPPSASSAQEGEEGESSTKYISHGFLFGRPKIEEKVTKMFPDIKGGSVKLYGANSNDPIAQVHLLTGQMWILKHLMLRTIDIAVAVIFSVVNLERQIEEERKKPGGRFPGAASPVHRNVTS
ncbi:hypothetical protein L873DRAFT_1841706 [Choiromyces venosus 120613-1]|uniref:Uncharacterized protein n=1 Tax=Choiromyces venosus 120613-1 TaxID=1336337 RepID=A0A3N4JWG3_9PEZI|nr:hypothetical protein L873DRAFT_1841706 [Choiromyces venosus 120613-1]